MAWGSEAWHSRLCFLRCTAEVTSCGRFDEECRQQVAENMELRGIKLYGSTSPTR